MLERIHKQLLKLPNIKKAIEDYRCRKDEQLYRERWSHLMSSSYTIRKVVKPINYDFSDTPKNAEDKANGRMVGQWGVTPSLIRPFGIGRWRL